MGLPSTQRRALVLAYQAAAQNKSMAPVQSTGMALAGYEGDVVRRRAMDAARNSPEIHSGLEAWKYELRGEARALPGDERALAAFDAWADACGYRHQRHTLAQQLATAIAVALNGRAWVQRVQVAPSSYTPNGLLLLVRGADEIDRSRGEHGLEYDQGAVVAGVWFRAPTLARGITFDFTGRSVFVDVRDLAELRIGDVTDTDDGEPLAHASLVPDRINGELCLADLRHKQAAANVTAIAHSERAALAGPGAFMTAGPTITGPNGEPMQALAPNTVILARGVNGVAFPRLDNSAVDHQTHRARIAAGMLHTLQTVGGDTGAASMSSLMHATAMMSQRGWDLGLDMGVPSMLRKILGWFLEAELLAGRNWYGELWDWLDRPQISVNPLRDAEAMALEVEQGWESVQGAIRRYGRDPRVVTRERAAWASDEQEDDGGRHAA